MKLAIQILIVLIIIGGLTWDNTAHANATWVSYVLFFGALAYILFVFAGWFRKPKPPRTMTSLLLPLLLLSGAAAGCARPASHTEQRAVAAVVTYTDANGYEVPVPADSARVQW